jgi:hypothetical protein
LEELAPGQSETSSTLHANERLEFYALYKYYLLSRINLLEGCTLEMNWLTSFGLV